MKPDEIKKSIVDLVAKDYKLSDKKIGVILGINAQTVSRWRREIGIQDYKARIREKKREKKWHKNFLRICEECHSFFVAHTKATIYCDDCRFLHHLRYYTICGIRRDFASLMQVNRKLADEIVEDMARSEGEDFVEFALDGLSKKKEVKKI